MNSGPNSVRPDDEASDPLLTALRQRLGDYGQAPPPGAWAAIRQQLPPQPALLRPWWRRPRRLLPLLGLLLGLAAIGTLAGRKQHSQSRSAAKHSQQKLPHTATNDFATPTPARQAQKEPRSTQVKPPEAVTASALGSLSAISPSSKIAPPAASPAPARIADLVPQKPVFSPALNAQQAVKKKYASVAKTSSLVATQELDDHLTSRPVRKSASVQESAFIGASRAGHRQRKSALLLPELAANRLPRAGRGPASQSQKTLLSASRLVAASLGAADPAKATYPTHQALRSALRAAHPRPVGLPGSPTLVANRHTTAVSATYSSIATRKANADKPVAAGSRVVGAAPLTRLGIDTLPLRWVRPDSLVVLAQPTVMARPDSTRPTPPPARRWALLALAGPTLSYRVLGATPAAATGTHVARLERPAAGLGAQVQVRRVLSGRWALAVGVGYQEYATRLALQVRTAGDSSYHAIHQRDAYRLLTLPVQVGYALGVPRGRLATAVLGGAEAGWYQGGRSTEGGSCDCQQQVYSSAAASPYAAWSLAFSLGLDLRYRVGSAASRWRWVVQPTGRYVLTPFVRTGMLGVAHRQPFSLGLLTGFSWDLR